MCCIPAASWIWHVMKMVNNLVCVLYLSSQRVLNYFANWLCEVSTWEPLCSSAKCSQSAGRSAGPTQFPESLEAKLEALGKAKQRKKMRDSKMTFNLFCSLLTHIQQNNHLIACKTCICTQPLLDRPHLQEMMLYWESLLPFALK